MSDFAKLVEQYGPLAPGWGNPRSGIIFIGDAPGQRELQTGEPFSGVSGRFFDDLLASIHLSRDEIYLTNAVKFRQTNAIRTNRKSPLSDHY